MKMKWIWVLLIISVPALFSCTPQEESPTREIPTEKVYKKGIAYVDFDLSEIIVKESYPMQVEVIAKGDLPTPCHEIRYEVADPDENKAIHISIYSEIEVGKICAEMLEAFEISILVGDFEEVGYSIWINDYEIGGF